MPMNVWHTAFGAFDRGFPQKETENAATQSEPFFIVKLKDGNLEPCLDVPT